MSVPLASVVVVAYQHANYIRECLDSVLNQITTFDFEIIVGEDESSDGTRDICQEYANKYPNKIKLLLHSRKDVIYIDGSGTGRHNFIECIKVVRGKYIALCDGDDYWIDKHKLQNQIDFLEQNKNVSLVFTNRKILLNGSEQDNQINYNEGLYNRKDVIQGLVPFFNTVCFRWHKDLVDYLIKTKYIYGGDYLLGYFNCLHGDLFYKKSWITAVYRITNAGIWSDKTKLQKDTHRIKSLLDFKRKLKIKESNHIYRFIAKDFIFYLFEDFKNFKNYISITQISFLQISISFLFFLTLIPKYLFFKVYKIVFPKGIKKHLKFNA